MKLNEFAKIIEEEEKKETKESDIHYDVNRLASKLEKSEYALGRLNDEVKAKAKQIGMSCSVSLYFQDFCDYETVISLYLEDEELIDLFKITAVTEKNDSEIYILKKIKITPDGEYNFKTIEELLEIICDILKDKKEQHEHEAENFIEDIKNAVGFNINDIIELCDMYHNLSFASKELVDAMAEKEN